MQMAQWAIRDGRMLAESAQDAGRSVHASRWSATTRTPSSKASG